MKNETNENLDDFEDNETREFVGHGVAYIDTGNGLTGTIVDYKIKYTSVGQERECRPKEEWCRPLDEDDFVLLIPPLANKRDVKNFLDEIRRQLEKFGLFLGTWPNQDYQDPYHLFYQSGRIVGTLESQLIMPEDKEYWQ